MSKLKTLIQRNENINASLSVEIENETRFPPRPLRIIETDTWAIKSPSNRIKTYLSGSALSSLKYEYTKTIAKSSSADMIVTET